MNILVQISVKSMLKKVSTTMRIVQTVIVARMSMRQNVYGDLGGPNKTMVVPVYAGMKKIMTIMMSTGNIGSMGDTKNIGSGMMIDLPIITVDRLYSGLRHPVTYR